MNEIVYCSDCKFCKKDKLGISFCHHPKSKMINFIDEHATKTCETVRSKDFYCGLFKKKFWLVL